MVENLGNLLTESWIRIASVSLMILLLVDLAIRKLLKIRDFRRKIDVLPGPPAQNLFLGNIPMKVLSLFTSKSQRAAEEFYTSQIQSVLGHTLIYKNHPFFRLWIGQEPVVCVWKPEIVETVLSDSFLLEKSYHYDYLRPWLGNGLLTSPGKIWRPRRKLLVPSFHFNILQAFVPVFDRKSRHLVHSIKLKLSKRIPDLDGADAEPSVIVDITPTITACTLDAICETIMGVSIDAQENPNNDYCQSIYTVGETFLERIIQPRYWLNSIFRLTELGKLYRYHLNKLHSFTRGVIAEKKKSARERDSSEAVEFDMMGTKLKVLEQSTVESYRSVKKDAPKLPKAFLDLLLDKVTSAGEQSLTDEEIREEVDTFMFEGHDTTAMALSWTLFLLGHNREAQRRLQAEVDEFYTIHKRESDLELDHLKGLKYLDCVIKESLRLCPSVPFIGRQTKSSLKLAGYTIPPGTVIFVLIYQLHRNSQIFPNPEKFDPDRFLPERTFGRNPFAYVPFSAGPRNCIGQKFAMVEMKTILLHLVRNFTFESVTPLDKAKIQMEMVLRPKCPLNIRVQARSIKDC